MDPRFAVHNPFLLRLARRARWALGVFSLSAGIALLAPAPALSAVPPKVHRPSVSVQSSTSVSVRVVYSARYLGIPVDPPVTDVDIRYRAIGTTTWSDHPFTLPDPPGDSSSTTITGLTSNTTYEVQVRLENADGEAAWSESTEVTPAAPTLSVNGVTTTTALLHLANYPRQWYYRGSQAGASCTGRVRGVWGYRLSGLTAGTSYTYKAYSDNDCTTELASMTFRTATALAAPTGLSAVPGNRQVTLTWTHPAWAENNGDFIVNEYQLKQTSGTCGTDGFGNWISTGANGTQYTVRNLSNGTRYCFRVRTKMRSERSTTSAVVGTSTASAAVDATLAAATPATPTGLSAAARGDRQVTLTWTAAARATGYRVRYRVRLGSSCTTAAGYGDWGASTGTRTSYTEPDLYSGTTYCFQVQATNSSGESAVASTSATPRSTRTPPKPNQLTANPLTSTSVSLMTHIPPEMMEVWPQRPIRSRNNGLHIAPHIISAVTDVDVRYRARGTVAWSDHSFTLPSRRGSPYNYGTTLTGLTSTTTYEVQVRFENENGKGPWSESLEFSPSMTTTTSFTQPPTPSFLEATPITRTSVYVRTKILFFPPVLPPVIGVDVRYRARGTVAWSDHSFVAEPIQANNGHSNFPSTMLTGLTPNRIYEVQVRFENIHGKGGWSESADAVTPANTDPLPSTRLRVVNYGNGLALSSTTAHLSFDRYIGRRGYYYYEIPYPVGIFWYRGSQAGASCTKVRSGGTFRLSGLTADTSYTYTVYSDSGCTTELASTTFSTATAPILSYTHSRAVVNGVTFTIRFADNLATVSGLTNSAFTVKKNGGSTGETLSGSPTVSGKTVTLTLSTAAVPTDTFRLSYAKPTTATARLRDAANNEVAAFSDLDVYNRTRDGAPLLSGNDPNNTTVNGATVTLIFNKNLAAAPGLTASAFTVKKNGGSTGETLSGPPTVSGRTVTLTLATAAVYTDTFTVSYAKPTIATDRLRDAANNEVAAFSRPLPNHTPDNVAPTLATRDGITVNGATVTLTFYENLAAASGLTNSAFTVKKNGGSTGETLSGAPTVSRNRVTLTLATAAVATDSFTVSYAKPTTATDRLRDTFNNEVAAFRDQPVVNKISTPAKPEVTATAGAAQVTLSWTAIATTTGWQVRQRTVGVGDWGAWTAIPDSGAATANHVVTGLTNGTLYAFQVRAKNAGGVGTASDEDRSRPVSTTGTAPTAPTGLTATGRDGDVLLSWAVNTTASSWEYRQRTGSGTFGDWRPMTAYREGIGFYLVPGLQRTYIVGGLSNGAAYGFEVRGVNARGTGTASAEVTATPAAPSGGPAKPTGVNATAGNKQVTLGWEVIAGATRWEYQRKAGTGGWGRWTTGVVANAGTATGFTATGLSNDVQYTYRVRAVDATGPGVASDPVSATPVLSTSKPVRVTDLTAESRGETAVRLEWSAQASHHDTVAQWQYRMKVEGDPSYGEWTGIERSGGQGFTGWTMEGLTTGTGYTFQVRGKNTASEGDASNEATVITEAGTAPAVAEVRVVHRGTTLEVEWDAPARATHYDVTYTNTGTGQNARAAWNRAGTSLIIRCDVRFPDENRDCVSGTASYTVGVRARNASGESAWTNSALVKGPLAAPDPVAAVTVLHKGGSLEVSWDAPARATHYDVTYTNTDTGQSARAAWNQASTSLTITCDSRPEHRNQYCVESGATYTVGVRARNASGESAWTNSAPATAAALSVADATVSEPTAGKFALLDFVVTLDRAVTWAVTVDYATADGTATGGTFGADYVPAVGTRTFAPGETSKTVSVVVLGDAHDDSGETLTLSLSNASGASISDATATGTITNDDPIPQAWISRFGRTVADQVLDAVDTRMGSQPAPGVEVTLAGEPLQGPTADHGQPVADQVVARLAQWLVLDNGDSGDVALRTVHGRELLATTSFAFASPTSSGGLLSFWGRGALSNFEGREEELALDGEVTTWMLGADWSWGQWQDGEARRSTLGLLLSRSTADGGYAGANSGDMDATLTGVFPWGRYRFTERLEAWAAAGYGQGKLEVTPKLATGENDTTLTADLNLWLAAAGLRGTLLDGGNDSLTLTGTTDALVVGTTSEQVTGLAAAEATVTRLRLGLEAQRPFTLGNTESGTGATLTPSLEMGLRLDGGDAETGFGLDLGGGITLSHPNHGLQAEVRGRGLLTHAAEGFRDQGFSGSLSWQQRPDSELGAMLSLTQTMGGSSSGGADALLSRVTLEGLADNDTNGDDDLKNRRLELQLSYGLLAFGDRFTLTPELGLGFYDSGRDYRIGWNLKLPDDGESFSFSFDVTRRENNNDGAAPEHGVEFNLDMQF